MSSPLEFVVARPVIGVAIRETFYFPTVFERCAELIYERAKSDETFSGVQIQRSDGSAFKVGFRDGTESEFSKTGVLTEFRYPVDFKQKGDLEFEAVKIEPETYDVLLEKVENIIKFLCNCLSDSYSEGKIKVFRVGVMLQADGIRDLLPPGIARRLQEIDPDSSMIALAHQHLLPIVEKENFADRCHYAYKFDRSADESKVNVTLDWQRVWRQNLNLASIGPEISKCAKMAKKHFEEVAHD